MEHSFNGVSVYTLFSGSKGNCTYVKTPDVELLFDAGVCVSSISRALEGIGSSLDSIFAIFVTHEHGDHIKGLAAASRKCRAQIHINERSAYSLSNFDELEYRMSCHPPLFSVSFGDTVVRSFTAPHDSAMCLGYTVSTPDAKIAVATDLGHVTQEVYDAMRDCAGVVIESNYDREMLATGPYPAYLKRRIAAPDGHLCNDDCASFVADLGRAGVGAFLLAHLSRDNNTPELAVSAAKNALASAEITSAEVRAASPDTAVPLF